MFNNFFGLFSFGICRGASEMSPSTGREPVILALAESAAVVWGSRTHSLPLRHASCLQAVVAFGRPVM